ncbi:MAG: hypothetical protein L0Y71_08445 [Gemmataceae bacterium]|nr:hypothetical protein [Gemmataceae bacterium]
MTTSLTEMQFRQAAESEDGMPVSAGARVAHVRLALESGRAVTIDLSHVPDDRRSALVAVIREMVRLSAGQPAAKVTPNTGDSMTAGASETNTVEP